MNDSLSVTQYYIQLDEELHPGTAKYNVGVYYKIYGALDIPRLCQAITTVVSSHDIFTSKEEVSVVDASGKSPTEILEWIEEDNRVPFQFDTGPLYTFTVFTFGRDLCIWYMKCHHILMDGWSFKLFFNQVAVAYENKSVEHIEGTYRAFVEEQNEYKQKPQYEKDRAFWREYFQDKDANTIFASNKEVSKVSGESVEIGFTQAIVKELEAIAVEQGVSLSQLFMASFSMILHKFYQKSSMTFGVPIMNRKKKYESVVGLFINLVPVRFELEKDVSLGQFLKAVKSEFLKVLRHQRFQHAEIVSALDGTTGTKRLYDVRFSFEPFDFAKSFAGHTYDMQPLSNHDEEEPISIHVRYYHEGDVRICCDYNTNFVCKDEVLSFMDAWKYLITELRGLLDGSVDQIFDHYTSMQSQVLTFGRHYEPVKRHQHEYVSCWQKAVHSYADKVCITFQGQKFTYREIEGLANAYATLYKSHKIDKVDRVIILLERSEKCVAAILAAMKIRATYIPLDINCPSDRIAAIYRDCGCKAVVTTTKYAPQVLGLDCILLDNSSVSGEEYTIQEYDPGAIAYIIYTSGSTGKPKGVPISNASLLDYVQGFIDHFKVISSDVVLQQASIAFDASVEEIFPVLAVGGTLSITDDNRDFAKILDELQTQKVTILSTNPYAVNYINEHADVSSLALRVLISGGAVLQHEDISSLVGKIPLYNTYGPTESTVCATYHLIDDHKAVIPIGKPCVNRSLYILDSSYRLLPPYAVGEIYIGGLGLTPGYINNPAENEKRFIAHPFKAGERIYKTGDLAKWNALGEIEYIGRNDEQIKLHGNRIELGEIEKVLRQFEEIQNAIVKVKNGSIAAFCESRHKNFDKAAIHKKLKAILPPYMLPVYYVQLTHIPLTDNGKLDERSLPAVTSDDLVRQEYRRAETPLQCSLVDVWKTFVGVEVIGLDDNFFEIGGHSLQMLHMRNQIQQLYGVYVSLSELNEHLTIEKLASLVEAKRVSSSPEVPMEVIPQSASYAISPTQQRLWILSQTHEAARAYHICGSYLLDGKVEIDAFRNALQCVADRHDSLRTVFTENQGQITQSIQPLTVDFEVVDLFGDTVQAVQEFYAKSFDLATGPLWRMAIFRVGNTCIVSASFHHIICDGWSVEILLGEISNAYAFKTLPKLTCQYKDYVYWQQKYVLSHAYLQDKEYWKGVFAGDVAKLNLPYDFARPVQKSYRGACVEHRFRQIDTIKAFGAHHQATLFMVLVAGLRALLYRYTGQTDFVLGTVVAGRDHSSLVDQVGVYVNTLLLRGTIAGSSGFSALLASERVREQEAFSHQCYPYDHVVEDLQVNDLLEVLVILHNQKSLLQGGGLQLPGVHVSSYKDAETAFSQFGLTFAFFEDGASDLVLKLEYDTDLFCKSTVEKLVGHYERLLTALIQDPECPLSDVKYLDEDETTLILDRFSGKDRPYIDYGVISV
ncbi:MAG: amino acid adenylation domain-containing protein, partial [Chlamydiales bacterium]|nr:amino acid adenylation domain-containing protein [Chlamydiales bacterium]